MKRLIDIFLSFLVILILLPLFAVIAILISVESPGGPFYRQVRVGRYGNPFKLYKFRSMRPGSDKKGLITIGNADSRITGMGKFVRKYKLDEFPQLINVIKGEMSVVGPRPEVQKYVDMYSPEQRKVLNVRPGLTDYASIEYFEENEILAQSHDPEQTYIDEVMPEKLRLNLKYIQEQSLSTDLRIIFKTLGKILS